MTVRIDKWLWAARFFKTRSLAKSAVEGGKVHYNGRRTKPSRLVEVGATLIIQQGFEQKTVVVTALSDQRRSATEARQLYQETPESEVKRESLRQQRRLLNANMPPKRRPDKKQRRQIIRFIQGE